MLRFCLAGNLPPAYIWMPACRADMPGVAGTPAMAASYRPRDVKLDHTCCLSMALSPSMGPPQQVRASYGSAGGMLGRICSPMLA